MEGLVCLPIAEKYFAGQYWEHISTFNIFNGMIFLCRNKLTFIRTQADLAGQGAWDMAHQYCGRQHNMHVVPVQAQ